MIPRYIIVFLLMISACEVQRDFSKDQVDEEVREMLDNYFIDIAKRGLTAEFQYLDQSSEFFWVPPGYHTALDYDSVKTILSSNALAYSSVKFKWKTLQVYPLAAEHATYTGVVEGVMIDTANVSSNILLIESGVIIKRADGWKLLSGQSATLPQ